MRGKATFEIFQVKEKELIIVSRVLMTNSKGVSVINIELRKIFSMVMILILLQYIYKMR